MSVNSVLMLRKVQLLIISQCSAVILDDMKLQSEISLKFTPPIFEFISVLFLKEHFFGLLIEG